MSKESNTSEDLLLVQIEQTCHLSPQRQVQRQKEIWMSKISVVYALGNCAKQFFTIAANMAFLITVIKIF